MSYYYLFVTFSIWSGSNQVQNGNVPIFTFWFVSVVSIIKRKNWCRIVVLFGWGRWNREITKRTLSDKKRDCLFTIFVFGCLFLIKKDDQQNVGLMAAHEITPLISNKITFVWYPKVPQGELLGAGDWTKSGPVNYAPTPPEIFHFIFWLLDYFISWSSLIHAVQISIRIFFKCPVDWRLFRLITTAHKNGIIIQHEANKQSLSLVSLVSHVSLVSPVGALYQWCTVHHLNNILWNQVESNHVINGESSGGRVRQRHVSRQIYFQTCSFLFALLSD